MIARISTQLDAPPDAVWTALKKKATFLHVTRGAIRFPGSEGWPEEFREGQRVSARMEFFGMIPAPWTHELHLVSVDDERRELFSSEGGGPLETWNHRIRVEPLPDGRTLYTDEIEIRAGALTLPVWIYAHLFYRYRQARWRGLARLLSGGYSVSSREKP
ncbi:MAG TPA: SRPBCC family protein [Rubrobacteraceae bacterium]|nr:SRPBCC family protein [Rubrobacteraceae bacterium]